MLLGVWGYHQLPSSTFDDTVQPQARHCLLGDGYGTWTVFAPPSLYGEALQLHTLPVAGTDEPVQLLAWLGDALRTLGDAPSDTAGLHTLKAAVDPQTAAPLLGAIAAQLYASPGQTVLDDYRAQLTEWAYETRSPELSGRLTERFDRAVKQHLEIRDTHPASVAYLQALHAGLAAQPGKRTIEHTIDTLSLAYRFASHEAREQQRKPTLGLPSMPATVPLATAYLDPQGQLGALETHELRLFTGTLAPVDQLSLGATQGRVEGRVLSLRELSREEARTASFGQSYTFAPATLQNFKLEGALRDDFPSPIVPALLITPDGPQHRAALRLYVLGEPTAEGRLVQVATTLSLPVRLRHVAGPPVHVVGEYPFACRAPELP